MAVDVGSAVGYLDLDISGFLNGLKSAQNEADNQTKNISTTIGNNISSVGKNISSVGTTLTGKVTVPLLGVGAAGLKVATSFEKGMSEVKAISGATGKDFDALREKAIELGADTAFSAGEVAEAMTEMAKAGWGSQQIIDGMSGVLSAAAASGEGLATVSTIVADAITGFGLEAKDSTKVADLLTQAANSGTIGIAELGESFKYIAPVAGAMGLSVEDVTTAISAMSMAGIKGSQAGTSLRTMLARMVKPTDAVADAMGELELELTNSDGSFKSLDNIIEMLRNSFSGLTDEEKTYYATILAGQEGMSGMLSLLNLTGEEYDEIAKSMDSASGVAESTAAIMQDNLQSKVEQLGGSLESLAIKLADYVLPHLVQLAEWLTGLIDKFAQLDPETQKTILKFAGIAIAAGPVLAIFGKMTSGVGSLITAFGNAPGAITNFAGGISSIATKLGGIPVATSAASAGAATMGSSFSALGSSLGALAGAAGPVLGVAAAIAVVTATIASLWKNNEDFRNNITATWQGFKDTFETLTTGIVDRLNQLGFDFENIGEVIKAIWTGFCDLLAPYFEGVFNYILIIFRTFVNHVLNVADFFIALFQGDWQGCWDAIKAIFLNIWNGIKDYFINILNVFTGIFDTILGWFGSSWAECWEAIKTFFVNVWNSIAGWFKGAVGDTSTFFTDTWTNVSNFFVNIWNGIVSFVTNTLNTITTTFKNIWNGITSFISNAWETIKNVVQVGIMFIVELLSAALQLITLPFRFIWENCKDIIIAVWEAIKTVISDRITKIQTVIMNVWNAVSSFFVSVWTSISDFISSAWNTISTVISVVIDVIKRRITSKFNEIKAVVETVFNAIKTVITNVFNAVKTFVSTVWNAIKTAITNVVDTIKTVITNVFNAIKTTVTNVFNATKTAVVNAWNAIKAAITVPINAAKDTITSVINTIKTVISNGFTSAKNTVTNIFNNIKNSISNVMNSAKTTVQNVIDSIKKKFNFSWSLPKLKMPHPKITGSFSLNPPSVPKFSIDWYKKAMNNGMILDTATIFGFNSKTGKFLAGGEAGSETVVGTKSLLSMIKDAVYEAIGPLVFASNELAKASADLGYVTYNGFAKLKESKQGYDGTSSQSDNGKGDTFVFYSPKAIDEIEAAKQIKKTKRELAEGF